MYAAGFFELSTVMTTFTLVPLYIRYVGGGDMAVGVQATVFTLFSVIFRIFLGPWADIAGRKPSLVLGAAVFATAPLGIWLAPNLLIMGFVRVYQAVGMATFLSAATSYIADHTPSEYRGTSLGLYRMSITFSVMLVPLLGMALIQAYGFWAYFIMSFAMGAAGFVLMLLLPGDKPCKYAASRGEVFTNHISSGDKEGPAAGHDVRVFAPGEIEARTIAEDERCRGGEVSFSDVKELFTLPALRYAYSGILFISMVAGVLLTYITIYAGAFPSIGNPAVYFTLKAGAGAGASILFGALSDRYGRRPFIIAGICCLAAGLLALVYLHVMPLPLFILSGLLTGTGFTAALSLLVASVVDAVPPRTRGTALAFQESAIDSGNTVGIFFFGLTVGFMGYGNLFLVLAIFIAGVPFLSHFISGGRRCPGGVQGGTRSGTRGRGYANNKH